MLKMRHNGNYIMEVDSLGNQGTKITIRKRPRMWSFAMIFAAFSGFGYLFTNTNNARKGPYQIYVAVAGIVVVFMLLIQLLTKVHKETLLILSSIGVTVKEESILTSQTKYFDLQNIQDIVIVEAVSFHSVICQLVLIPKNSSSCDTIGNKLYPLFQSFQPSLKDLKTIYRHTQTKLIQPLPDR